MNKIKIFISQPMNGLKDDEIKDKRKELVQKFLSITTLKEDEIVIIDSFFEGAPHDAAPLWYLGESLKKLAEASVAIFAHGWQSARGCQVEELACRLYRITVLDEGFIDDVKNNMRLVS